MLTFAHSSDKIKRQKQNYEKTKAFISMIEKKKTYFDLAI